MFEHVYKKVAAKRERAAAMTSPSPRVADAISHVSTYDDALRAAVNEYNAVHFFANRDGAAGDDRAVARVTEQLLVLASLQSSGLIAADVPEFVEAYEAACHEQDESDQLKAA